MKKVLVARILYENSLTKFHLKIILVVGISYGNSCISRIQIEIVSVARIYYQNNLSNRNFIWK